jgi:ribose-phosphate pyrophosphokinase
MKLEDLVIASPDVGGSKRASSYAKYLGVDLVLCHKQRAKANVVESMKIIGDVKGKNVIILDDMVDTAGTITKAADLMIDAAKRASAKKVIPVIPYFGWARQDRKDKPRVSIGAKLIADLLTTAGIDRVITLDLHADQIQGFFDCPVDHLLASSIFLPYIQSMKLEDLVIASPDVGGSKRASSYAKYLGVDLVLCHKQRAKANVVESMKIIGDVKGKNVIILDDMVDTAGTITKAADLMIENGALSVRAFASHGVLSDPATERIEKSKLTAIYFTDSIPLKKESEKIKVLSVAELIANTIINVNTNKSISSSYLV